MPFHSRAVPLLIFLSFLTFAARAAGIREIRIPADARGPQISARLWTPCAKPPQPMAVDSGVGLVIHAIKDCSPIGRGLPLILISHGLFGDIFSHHDTAEFLADGGFVVITLDHPQDAGSALKSKSADDIASFLARPVDIRRTLDFLLSNPEFAAIVDAKRIGFFGFSRGGYTGLVLAGAVPNFHALRIPCPEKLLMCRQIRDNAIPHSESGYEPRIKAFVIADPISFFPDKASLQNIHVPIQLWSSSRGEMGVRPEDVAAVAKNLPAAPEFHKVPYARHLSFNFPCTAEEAKAMDPLICAEPSDFDRVTFHKFFNVQLLEFFRKHLPVLAALSAPE